ncbi:serine/threonine-protein kinase [Amycolatopsis rhabdoformis]|uniref:non-specific serine/threonine protein kinase n=1 Tax=Amycolatopsis rhabdoformis TaxID=1448059 RepID=A0ABZ1I6U0_9PSEU|nr:serine/threonine-protein kinase [Amycolatopsis rhabdoformis]WSE29224.1 serine/threonine-protein kinase [Amycolatopsis rhabdoformis]
MSDEGRLVAGRYRIIGRIGTGAMGAVWQAHDEVLGRTVAVKQLLMQPGLDEHDAEDARQRTMREGRIAARLHHPNAISVFDVVTDDNGQPCLIMEYLNSTSLAQVLQERGTLPPLEVARIGAQVAAALREAHAVGIVHRDIKPGNILLAGTGTVKITDFGISRAKDDVTVTKTGMIAGTPAYLAPEVAIGGDPGPESDVFSLGSTLYAACEGQPPFGLSENTLSLLHAVAAGQINPPRQSGPLASVLAVLLHPDIHHRPTAEECEELLASVARGETPLGGPAGETVMVASAGTLGAAAVAGAAATHLFPEEDMDDAAHSGTLLDQPGPAQQYYDDEAEYPAAAAYPQNDYDGYDQQYQGEPPLYGDPGRNGLAATRSVPTHDVYADDQYDDGYDDGYDEPPPPARGQTSPTDDEDEKPGAWKKPAIIGAIVVVGLVALGVWLLSSNNPPDASQQPAPPPTSSAVVPTTDTAPSSEEATTSEEETSSQEQTSSRETTSSRRTSARNTPSRETSSEQETPSTTSSSKQTTAPSSPTTTPSSDQPPAGG